MTDSLISDKHDDPKQQAIGVFDAGLGGLSVLKEIHALLPHEDLIYIGDSAFAPYGDRNAEYVRKRSLAISQFLIKKNVKAIVIACNTATAEAATELRKTCDIPIIGLEPAIKPAAQLSESGVIGVLATQRTINSKRLLGLTERYASNKIVLLQACSGLVEQVECCELNTVKTHNLLKHYIQPLLNQGADALILGCTHYPFLLKEIRKITGDTISILETGKPVAKQLQRVLTQHKLKKKVITPIETHKQIETHQQNSTNKADYKAKLTFYNSSHNKQQLDAMKKLWQSSYPSHLEHDIEILELPKL